MELICASLSPSVYSVWHSQHAARWCGRRSRQTSHPNSRLLAHSSLQSDGDDTTRHCQPPVPHNGVICLTPGESKRTYRTVTDCIFCLCLLFTCGLLNPACLFYDGRQWPGHLCCPVIAAFCLSSVLCCPPSIHFSPTYPWRALFVMPSFLSSVLNMRRLSYRSVQ